jgi:putative Mn2+ efflux pump MntP
MLTTLFLAAGLSVDSMAAAMATGFALRRPRVGDAGLVGIAFAACQMATTFIGLLLGEALLRVVGDWDHWVAFVLLGLAGAQMIREALVGDADAAPARLTWTALLAMGLGTSIDAGIVGVGLGVGEFDVSFTVGVIGAVTFAFSFAGVMCGCCVGRRVGTFAQAMGGIVLIAIGTRILVSHLSA